MTARCNVCQKKVPLSGIAMACAKCQKSHCAQHRLPETHACSHDFMKEGKTLLEKQNPRITASKVDKI